MGTDMARRTATHGAPRHVFADILLTADRTAHALARLDTKRLPGNLSHVPTSTAATRTPL